MPQIFKEKWKKSVQNIEEVSCVESISTAETWWKMEGTGATDSQVIEGYCRMGFVLHFVLLSSSSLNIG